MLCQRRVHVVTVKLYLKENDLVHFLFTSAQFKLTVVIVGHVTDNVR